MDVEQRAHSVTGTREDEACDADGLLTLLGHTHARTAMKMKTRNDLLKSSQRCCSEERLNSTVQCKAMTSKKQLLQTFDMN